MPRPPRVFSAEAAYHIISRGNNRQSLFKRPEDFRYFLFILRELKREYQFYVYHYCLMTNHVHLLLQFDNGIAFQKVPQRLNLLYAKYFSRTYQHVGHVFQDRFKSLLVGDNTYLLECGRYIERNPVKAKMVSTPDSYEWSSFRFYADNLSNDLLTPNPLYLDISSSNEERQEKYKSYVTGERPYDAAMEKIIFGKFKN